MPSYPSIMSSRVIIDPDWDILLQLQHDPPSDDAPKENTMDKKIEVKELAVSSKVLSLCSPVFKAMINGSFKEGIELAEKRASPEPYILSLPEDDVEATAIFCRILHFKFNEIPEKPTTICLEKLAFLCDKYQCISTMSYCGGLWLRDWLLVYDNEDPSIDDLCRLLVFAYIINRPYEFLSISWKLVLYHKGQFLGPYTQAVILVDHPLLRQDLARTGTLFPI